MIFYTLRVQDHPEDVLQDHPQEVPGPYGIVFTATHEEMPGCTSQPGKICFDLAPCLLAPVWAALFAAVGTVESAKGICSAGGDPINSITKTEKITSPEILPT